MTLRGIFEDRTALALVVLKLGLGSYILLFPVGMAARNITAGVALGGVVLVYALDWKNSNLARLGMRWIYFAFWAWLAVKCVDSISPASGLYVLKNNSYKALILFFAGLEFVRSKRDLPVLAGLFAAMACYEGLDGVWQFATGTDLIRGTEARFFRLTGSMSTPRVGNALAIIVPCAAAAFHILPGRLSPGLRAALTGLILAPPLFLLHGSYTRTALVGLGAALALRCFLHSKRAGLISLVLIPAALLGVTALNEALNPKALSLSKGVLDQLLDNPRLALWSTALDMFMKAPLAGHGVNTFGAMLHVMGVVPPPPIDPGVTHPHNIYLQLSAETGLIGLGLFLALAGGIAGRAAAMVIRERKRPGTDAFGPITAMFVSGFAAYLTTGVSGHGFYRTWWLGLAMALLGILAGAVVSADRRKAP